MSDLDHRVLNHLNVIDGSTAWAMRKAVDAPRVEISKALQRLKRKGLVNNDGYSKSYWRAASKPEPLTQ